MGGQVGTKKALIKKSKTKSKLSLVTIENSTEAAALKMLQSVFFFQWLREALQGLGLTGWEQRMGIGVYVAAVSGFQNYPLRIHIDQQTEGTANYIFRKVLPILLPGTAVVLSAVSAKEWNQFSESPNGKLLFVPQLFVQTREHRATLEILGDRAIRTVPTESEGRIIENSEEVEGKFACVSPDRPEWSLRIPRWLTMRQPKRAATIQRAKTSIALEIWHAVARLLQTRAQVPIIFPEWEQVLVELMVQRDDKSLRHIPALMQLWRTISMIRSFQSEKNDNAAETKATFEDLLVTILLGKPLFREGTWLPSGVQLLEKLPMQSETSVLNPLTGKGVRYRRPIPKANSMQHSLNFTDEVDV